MCQRKGRAAVKASATQIIKMSPGRMNFAGLLDLRFGRLSASGGTTTLSLWLALTGYAIRGVCPVLSTKVFGYAVISTGPSTKARPPIVIRTPWPDTASMNIPGAMSSPPNTTLKLLPTGV